MMHRDSLRHLDFVSCETLARLEEYHKALLEWNKAVSLVSTAEINHIWQRHIGDSAQIAKHIIPKGHWVDVGSGGGFPGLVIAILSHDIDKNVTFTLIERDSRKAAFLRAVAIKLALNVHVVSLDVRDFTCDQTNIVSARAFAPLAKLFELTHHILKPDTICVLPKGRQYRKEIETALKGWRFDWTSIKSEIEPDGVILKVWNIARS